VARSLPEDGAREALDGLFLARLTKPTESPKASELRIEVLNLRSAARSPLRVMGAGFELRTKPDHKTGVLTPST
jgi:hypothetical protein